MRRDEVEALREQKKHLLAEFRSLSGRYDDGKAWIPEDAQRRDHLIGQVEKINDDLTAQHKRELEEIRSGGGGNADASQKLPAKTRKPSSGLEPETPSLPWRCSTN